MLKKCLWNELLNQDFNPQSPGLEVNLHQRPDPLTFMSLPQRAVRKGVQGWRHHEGRESCLLWLLLYLSNTWNSFWHSMDANKYVLDELMLFFTESLLLHILYAEL